MSLSQSKEIAAPIADDVADSHAHSGAHAVPRRILLGVYGILLVLTVLTVSVSQIDLGQFNIAVALLVAVIKGSLVVLYFMHLRWDSPFNAVVFIAALFFAAIFIGMSLLDTQSYHGNLQLPQTLSIGR